MDFRTLMMEPNPFGEELVSHWSEFNPSIHGKAAEIFKEIDGNFATEDQYYAAFSKAFEQYKLCPGYELRVVANSADQGEDNKLKVDAALFSKRKMSSLKPGERLKGPYWAYQRTSIEFKRSKALDPFDDVRSKAEAKKKGPGGTDGGESDVAHSAQEAGVVADEDETGDERDIGDKDADDQGEDEVSEEDETDDAEDIIDAMVKSEKPATTDSHEEDLEDVTTASTTTAALDQQQKESTIATSSTRPSSIATLASEAEAEKRQATRVQLISYARLVFSRQHRHFTFTVLVTGKEARIIRWDRSGAIVTASFDWTKEDFLVRFFFCLGRMTLEEQGIDTTATEVRRESKDHQLMLAAVDDPGAGTEYAREAFKKSMAVEGWALWKLRVTPESRKKIRGAAIGSKPRSRCYLVGKPHFEAFCMAGRATRGYIALDCRSKKLVWLKDAWRVDLPGIDKEGFVLAMLNEAGVRNIPTLLYHGDVGQQRTLTQVYAPESVTSLKGHVHYRLIVQEICRSLDDFLNGRELAGFILNCLEAHGDAVEKASIMHRDISVGNLLIYEYPNDESKRKALLCDWELSKKITGEHSNSARQPDRTGTWQFMSAVVLDNHTKVIEVADELESIFNVWFHQSTRFTRSTLAEADVPIFLRLYYDESQLRAADHRVRCGQTKREIIKAGSLEYSGTKIVFLHDTEQMTHPVNRLYGSLLRWFRARYMSYKDEHPDSLPTVPTTSSKQAGLSAEQEAAWNSLAAEEDAAVAAERQTWLQYLRKLDTMTEMYNLIKPIVEAESLWPLQDRVGDRVKAARDAQEKKRKSYGRHDRPAKRQKASRPSKASVSGSNRGSKTSTRKSSRLRDD